MLLLLSDPHGGGEGAKGRKPKGGPSIPNTGVSRQRDEGSGPGVDGPTACGQTPPVAPPVGSHKKGKESQPQGTNALVTGWQEQGQQEKKVSRI